MTDEDGLIGRPLEDVPQREPGEHCNGRRKQRRDAEIVRDDEDRALFAGYCQLVSGWGTDGDSGRCRKHGGSGGSGGARDGAGAPEDNTNAVTHGAYAEENNFYQNELSESLQTLVDEIFEDYLEEYKERHGIPPLGLKTEIFRLSVSHVKDIVLDNWAAHRPTSLETANPLIEEETEKKFVEGIGTIDHNTYKESVVLAAQKKLSSDRRQWLKELGLLKDPSSEMADSVGSLAEAIRNVAGDQ